MSQRIFEYFKYVSDEVGLDGRVQLSQKIKLTSIQATLCKEDDELLEKVKTAVEEVTGKPAPNFKKESSLF